LPAFSSSVYRPQQLQSLCSMHSPCLPKSCLIHLSRADPRPPQLFDPITSSNDRGESSKVSLDDMPAPETTPAPVHKPTPTIPAYTSMSSSISSLTHAPTSQLSSATAPAVQAPPSITREQKCLEITTPRLLNSRGAITKVPTAKTSSGRTVYANTRYSQPDKKSPSSHALATDDN